MKLRKTTRIVAVGAVAALTLTACGSSGESSDDDTAAGADETPTATGDQAADDGTGTADTAAQDCGEHDVRVSLIASETSTWARASEDFKTQVEEGSEGRISVEWFPGGQLANANQQSELESVQQGTIDALWVSPIILALFMDQRFDIYSLPFLFPDHEVANEVVDGPVGEMTEEWLREGGLEPLGWGVNGFRQLTNSVRAVETPEDLDGLRLRVAGTDMYLETFDLLGADALTMNFGEVFTSLQQGVIDGQENPLSIIVSSSLEEVQSHISMWNYSYDPLVLAMNSGVFDEFCQQDQQLLSEAATAAGQLQRELTVTEDEEVPQQLEEAGMTVTTMDEMDIDAFKELVVEPIYSEWESVIGAEELQMMREAVEQAQG